MPVGVDRVILTSGTSEGISSLSALADAGDEVLIPDADVRYTAVLAKLGARAVCTGPSCARICPDLVT